jgi:hypothetical protein
MFEVLTKPTVFPALGPDVSIDYRTHPVDLTAQKLSLSAPSELPGKYRAALDQSTTLLTTLSLL